MVFSNINYNNKLLRFCVSFLLVISILISFGTNIYIQKVQAEALLLGIGIKIVATILAAMGVLIFVNSQSGGVSGFFDGLIDHMEKVQGVTNALGLFVKLGKDIIVDKAKLGASSLVQNVKDYYNIFIKSFQPSISNLTNSVSLSFDTAEFDNYLSGTSYSNGTLNDYREKVYSFIDGVPFENIFSLGNNHYAILAIDAPNTRYKFIRFQINTFFLNPDSGILENGSFFETTTHGELSYSTLFSKYNIHVDLSFIDSVFSYSVETSVFSTGNVKSYSRSLDMEIGSFDVPVMDSVAVPGSTDVSKNLEWGWQIADKVGNVVDSLGKSTAEIFDKVNSNVKDYVAALEKVGTKVNDIKAAEIVVENDVVVDVVYPDLTGIFDKVGDIDVGVGELGAGIKENTGILKNILSTIQNIFVTDNPLPLDFSPLSDISIKDKFPFSLPWDLQRSFEVLVKPPQPVKFVVPIVSEKITIDLSTFDKWAVITRTFLSIIFIIGLAILTRRFIGGA